MGTAVIDINDLLVVRPDFREGRPRIAGTRLTVHTIAAAEFQGLSLDEIVESFPQASVAGIHAALAYYHRHREQIEADFEKDEAAGLALAAELGAEVL